MNFSNEGLVRSAENHRISDEIAGLKQEIKYLEASIQSGELDRGEIEEAQAEIQQFREDIYRLETPVEETETTNEVLEYDTESLNEEEAGAFAQELNRALEEDRHTEAEQSIENDESPTESDVVLDEAKSISEDTETASDDEYDEVESGLESSPSYLELKFEYKEAKRAYQAALEQDVADRSALKRMFGLGRSQLSPETQALYDESLAAEKAYYQSFLETKKDKVEERLNKYNESEEDVSVVPSLVKRHITNPAEARFEIQKRELPPQIQAIIAKVKENKRLSATIAGAGVGASLALKGLSILSTFGVGLAAGAGTRWTMNKVIAGKEKRLAEKTETFDKLFESGEWEDLEDIKDEYFQDLRTIDDRKLQANLAAAGVAIAAGSSVNDAIDGVTPVGFNAAWADEVGESVGGAESLAVDQADVAGAEAVESESVSETLTPEDKEQTSSVINQGVTVDQDTLDSFSDPATQEDYKPVSPERLAEITEKAEARNEWIEDKVEELKNRPGYSDKPDFKLEETAEKLWRNAQYLEISEKMGMDLKPGDPLKFTVGLSGPPSINGEPIPVELYNDLLEAERPQSFMWEKSQTTLQEDSPIVPSESSVDRQEVAATESAPAEVSESQFIDEAIAIAERMGTSVDGIPDYRVEDGVIVEVEGQHVAEQYRSTEVIAEQMTSYEVKSGDTLSEIAQANDVSIKELMEANPDIISPHEINVGQEINIPAATGSSVYDGGVGLGGPGSEGFESASDVGPNETPVEVETSAPEATETAETSQSQTDSPELMGSPESAPMGDLVYGNEKPEVHAEVPDYSGGVPVVESEPDWVRPDEENNVPEVDTTASKELISTVPQETVTASIMEKQVAVENLLKEPLPRGWPENFDYNMGYEPLFTNELMERSLTIVRDTNLDKLNKIVANEMYAAYQSHEINLPVQWVHNLDYMDDKPTMREFVSSFGGDYREYKEMFNRDITPLKSLSEEQIKQLGISSGSFDNIKAGDQINMGNMITMIMQNMSERINNGSWELNENNMYERKS